jgi:hypothetical protein
MASAQAHLAFWYPYLSEPSDPRFVPPDQQELALEAGLSFRPKCLSEDLQNLAQAHYAAYLLSARYTSKMAGGTGVSIRPMYIEQEQQGDVIVKYTNGVVGVNAQAMNLGPISPYDAFMALARRCTRGAILTRFS